MNRTEEQIAADNALTEAIERCAKAYEIGGGVMGDYVVVAALQELREDQTIRHSYSMLLRDGTVAGVTVIGLLEAACFDTKMGRSD